MTSRLGPALAVALLVLASGCLVPSRPSATDWPAEAAQTLETVESELATMRLTLREQAAGSLPGGYAVVTAVAAEDGASSATSRLLSFQPPTRWREEYDEVTELLGRAGDQLAAARIALADGRSARYAGLARDLERLSRESAELRQDLS